jgi:H+/gluconate symporter-like permease
MCHPRAVVPLLTIIEVLATFIGNMVMSMLLHLIMSVNRVSTEYQQSINRASTECQQSINNLGYCILYDPRAVLQHLPIINVLAAFMGKREGDKVTAPV